jgi:hypothetical protein
MLYETLGSMKEAARDRMYAMEDKRRAEAALYDTEEQLMAANTEIERLKEVCVRMTGVSAERLIEAHAEIARLKSICLSMGWNNGSN